VSHFLAVQCHNFVFLLGIEFCVVHLGGSGCLTIVRPLPIVGRAEEVIE